MPQEQEICCFWGGDAINYLEALSLASFVAAGHPVTLYAYHPSGPTPKGVIVKDAADILPQDAAPASLLADLFRYHCLAQRPGVIWVAPDFVLMQPLRTEDGRLLAEQGGGYLSPDVLALPPDSMALRTILAFIAETRPIPPWATPEEQAQLAAMKDPAGAEDLGSGVWGAKALTHFAKKSGEAENALPKTAFYPLAYADRAILLTRKEKVENFTGATTAAIPLYGREIARQLHEVEAGLPKYWCPLGALLRQFGIAPRSAPIYEIDPKADNRWADEPVETLPPQAAPPIAAVKPPMKGDQKVLIVTTMKNEGPFILEWIAYHRSIGVTDFIVYTNDCDDGTDELLDLLVREGVVNIRIDNPFKADKGPGPQWAAYQDARNQPGFAEADWVIPMDCDEFINIHVGDGTLADLFAAYPDANLFSMVWRLFGNDDTATFDDRFITEQLTAAARLDAEKPYQARGFKTMFRNNGIFEELGVHRPKVFDPAREAEINWIASSGGRMPDSYHERGWRVPRNLAGYQVVTLNHYAVRTAESYLVKRQRGRVNHVDHDQGLSYWFRMNHNSARDETIFHKLPRAKAERDRLMANADIAAQHEKSVAHHRGRIAELKEKADYAALYDEITSKRLKNLSRMSRYFGNQIYNIGPQALPDDFVAWIDQFDEHGRAPANIGPPPVKENDTLAPSPKYAAEIAERMAEKEARRMRDAAAIVGAENVTPAMIAGMEQPKVQRPSNAHPPTVKRTATAPSGDPIYLGEADKKAFASLLGRTQTRYPHLTPISPARSHEKITAITSMKNEGPFILEWIAYHRAIGVTHFLVYTNDCDDPTNEILDHLAGKGWLTRIDNPFNRAAGQKPQRGALNHAIKQVVVQSADWYLVIDVDEFVNIHVGDGTLKALAEAANDPSVISMSWRFFGNKGVEAYQDRWVTEQFVHCAPQYLPRPRLGWGFKSMIRTDAPVGKIGVHRPLDINWKQEDNLRWVNGSGREMPRKTMKGSAWFSRKASIGYDMVTLNHYILRSAESFLVKRERGRINHVDQDQGLEYWATRNYATERDESILNRLNPAKAVLDSLLADPALAALHEAAVTWHQDRIAKLKADPEYLKLFRMITDPAQKDAIYVAEAELEDVSD